MSDLAAQSHEKNLVWKALRAAEAVVCIGTRADAERRLLRGRRLIEVCDHARISPRLALSRACPFGGEAMPRNPSLSEKACQHFWHGLGQVITAMRKQSLRAPRRALRGP